MKFIQIDRLLMFSVYVLGLFYSFYRVYLLSNEKIRYYRHLNEGWSFIGRRKDDMDWEWKTNKEHFLDNYFLFCIHLFIFELLRMLRVKQLSPFFAVVGFCLFYQAYGARILAVFLITDLLYFAISKAKSKKILWIATVGLIAGYSQIRRNYNGFMNSTLQLDHNTAGIFGVMYFWNLLKCTSFVDDKIQAKDDDQHYSLIDFVGYSFYFPTILFGPIIIYDKFRNMLINSCTLDFHSRAKEFLKAILICAVCLLVHDYAQHYFYVNILAMNTKMMYEMNLWAFYGLGYLLGQFFNNKYMVSYGFGIAFGKFDGIDMPRKPICIGRVHLYSDMWKRFDEGLYQFLFRHIYTKMTTRTASLGRRILSSAITFSFIYIWHGIHTFIFIWSFLNWLCVVMEGLLDLFMTSSFMQKFIGWMSEDGKKRVNALFGANILILSVISNYIFFAREPAYSYLWRTYTDNITNYLGLFPFAYCWYRNSEFLKSKIEGKEKIF